MGTNSSPEFSSDDDDDDDDDSDDEVAVPGPVVVASDACIRSTKDDGATSSNPLPLTHKRKSVSYYGVHRDKESLLEEVQALQEAFQDQKFHYKAHKEHHHAMQAENSRLESQIDYLERSGLEAPRTGTLTKLKSKLKGCKTRLMELETSCGTKAAEVRKLRMDTQFVRTQEATVQRDLFALEVRRLQRCFFHLNNLHKKVGDDNEVAVRLKAEITRLTTKLQGLETSVSLKRKSIEDMAVESSEWAAKGAAAKAACAGDTSRFKSVQEESKSVMDALFKEKVAKADLTSAVNTLSHQVRVVERETREKDRDAATSN